MVAVELAERIGAEILSLDSMAIYRQMEIGTAKPTAEERRRVPHHLVDIVDAWQEFNLADYLRAVGESLRGIMSRGAVPLFVGGTPLYLKALLFGAHSGPPPNPTLRTQFAQHAVMYGNRSLHDQLTRVDAVAARRIHPNDTRRIIRALEVFHATGAPISGHQVHFYGVPQTAAGIWCLDIPRAELYRRIDDRVTRMFQRGLVDEVRRLMESEFLLSRTARQALGYKEVIMHLSGATTLADTIDLVQRRSRQFAKRQLTWFRSIRECRWVPVRSDGDVRVLADTLMSLIRGQS